MFTLAPLPYAMDALEPHISARTMEFHYGKHHQTYVNNLNGLLKDDPLADASLVEIIRAVHGDDNKIGVFNNAAQVWNHDFFWQSMQPQGGGKPSEKLATMIDRDFGGYDKFCEQFKQAATTQFGSGWAWLVQDAGKLRIVKTANAANPLTVSGLQPLLTCDVWEHAYYLDFQNRRPDFVQAFLDHLVNWNFVADNLTVKVE